MYDLIRELQTNSLGRPDCLWGEVIVISQTNCSMFTGIAHQNPFGVNAIICAAKEANQPTNQYVEKLNAPVSCQGMGKNKSGKVSS